jgi:hypothetical protein
MQHPNGEDLIKGRALASAHVRNVRLMDHPLPPFRPSGNVLRSGMMTSNFRGNLVDFPMFPPCGLMGIEFDSSRHFHLLALTFLRLCKLVQPQKTVIQYVYLTVFFSIYQVIFDLITSCPASSGKVPHPINALRTVQSQGVVG